MALVERRVRASVGDTPRRLTVRRLGQALPQVPGAAGMACNGDASVVMDDVHRQVATVNESVLQESRRRAPEWFGYYNVRPAGYQPEVVRLMGKRRDKLVILASHMLGQMVHIIQQLDVAR